METDQTFKRIRAQARRPGVKVYAVAAVTADDTITVEVKKGDFLKRIADWPAADVADRCIICTDGDILIG